MYVLESQDKHFLFNDYDYIKSDLDDGYSINTTSIKSDAKKYTLEDGEKMARRIKNAYGKIFRVLRNVWIRQRNKTAY